MPQFSIATFNAENLFSRAKIFDDEESSKLLKQVEELSAELRKPEFDKERIRELSEDPKLKAYIRIVSLRGSWSSKKIKGAADWLGWVEFIRERVDDVAIQNTARVIADVGADIFCLCEIENRLVLKSFYEKLLKSYLEARKHELYRHILLIDGNDERGIDVALMSRFPIGTIRTHLDDRTIYQKRETHLFSRDCLEVEVVLPNGERVLVLVNHLKSQMASKGDERSSERRRGQAEALREIVIERRKDFPLLIVAGDLNSPPDDSSVEPIVVKSKLFNVNERLGPAYGDRRGTFGTGKQQLDYLLVSEPLENRLLDVQLERRGVWAPKTFEHYDTVTRAVEAASDHHAVRAAFEL
jgi:endonuclease/exonuclease/phosphatase family metal-dependent hydrolase